MESDKQVLEMNQANMTLKGMKVSPTLYGNTSSSKAALKSNCHTFHSFSQQLLFSNQRIIGWFISRIGSSGIDLIMFCKCTKIYIWGKKWKVLLRQRQELFWIFEVLFLRLKMEVIRIIKDTGQNTTLFHNRNNAKNYYYLVSCKSLSLQSIVERWTLKQKN